MTVKEENLPILTWIQEKTRVKLDESGFRYAFRVGDKFHIHLESSSEELALQESIMIDISQHTKECDEKMEPSHVEVENIHIQLDWVFIPPSVHPEKDERFISQEWSSAFEQDWDSFAGRSVANLPPDTICDIVRFCHTLSNLKAFW